MEKLELIKIKGSLQTEALKKEINTNIEDISVLLVEDNCMGRKIALNTLEYYNCTVTEAENGLEALGLLKTGKYDIILMDIQMPEMNGIETTKIIRDILNLDIPIIALTAYNLETVNEEYGFEGFDDFLFKPFDEYNLMEIIFKYFSFERKPKLNNAKYLYNIDSLLKLSRGNIEYVKRMISIYIEHTQEIIEKIDVAIQEENYKAIYSLIHKLKPSTAVVMVSSIIDSINEIELLSKKAKNILIIATLYKVVNETLNQVITQLKDNELNKNYF